MTAPPRPTRSSPGLWLLAAAAFAPAAGCIAPARIAEVDAAQIARLLTSPPPASVIEPVPSRTQPGSVLRTEPISTELPATDDENLSPARGMYGVEEEAPDEFAGVTEVIAQPLPRRGAFEEVAPGPIVAPSVGTMPMFRDIRDISLDIAPPALVDDRGDRLPMPTDYASAAFAMAPPLERNDLMGFSDAVGIAPTGLEFCYQPLYFEEVNLERYGRSFGILQPIVSGGQFYTRTALLPYHVFAQPARRCTWHPHWTLPGYRIPCRE